MQEATVIPSHFLLRCLTMSFSDVQITTRNTYIKDRMMSSRERTLPAQHTEYTNTNTMCRCVRLHTLFFFLFCFCVLFFFLFCLSHFLITTLTPTKCELAFQFSLVIIYLWTHLLLCPQDGAILVFVPGWEEISNLHKLLQNNPSFSAGNGHTWFVRL